jgi:hypothetical protein
MLEESPDQSKKCHYERQFFRLLWTTCIEESEQNETERQPVANVRPFVSGHVP